MKTKSNCKKEPLSSKPKKTQADSPRKLSTLDNWLCKLYQAKKPKMVNKVRSAIEGIEKNPELTIRLEKLDLLKLKDTLDASNRMQPSGVVEVKRTKKNRSSEYIKLANKQYRCAKCTYTTGRTINIRTHYDKEHGTDTFKCNLCQFETKLQYYFNNHMRYHNIPDKECPYCKKMIKVFSYKTHIKVHERNDKTDFKCAYCNYQSYNRANVNRHTLTIHENVDELPVYYCDSCDYVTILEERLKRHKIQVHLKEGVWVSCPQCEYTTRNKGHMKRHKITHSEKTVKCPQCSQFFGCKELLGYHIKRMHTQEDSKRYYYCEMCPAEQRYKTTEKGNLARHILAHRTMDEIEVFACHKCPYMGKSKNALKVHLINAHLPEMHSFKCQVCGYSTNVKSRFRCHLNEVHGKPKATKLKPLDNNNTEPMETGNESANLQGDLHFSNESDFSDMNLIKEEIIDLDENPLFSMFDMQANNNGAI